MQKLLLLTYAFPPHQAPESYLSAKALGSLKKFKVDVLTIDPTDLGLPMDTSLDSYVAERFNRINRIKTPSWLNGGIFGKLRCFSAFPDRFRILNKRMIEEAQSLDLQNYAAMISWSQWHSVHLAANIIKKKNPAIRWIAHMSDPWADNPFLPKIPGYKAIQTFLEKTVIRNADEIHFTTEETRRLVMRKYPPSWADKTYVFPHAFEPDLYEQAAPPHPPSGHVIRYLGNFYGPRNPKTLAQAVASLAKSRPDLLKNVHIELIGRWIGNRAWRPENEGVPEGLMNVKSPVSYLESLRLMRDAGMLLILDAPFEISVFFPSKLVDYIGANKPILAFTPEGTCANVLRNIGGMVFSPESAQTIEKGLELALDKLKSGTAPLPDKQLAEQYSAKRIGAMRDDLLTKLVAQA